MDIHVTLRIMRNTDLPMDERVEAALNVLVWCAKNGARTAPGLEHSATIGEAEAVIIAALQDGPQQAKIDWYLEHAGYSSVAEWAEDSDYTEADGEWLHEEGHVVNIEDCLSDAIDAMVTPPNDRPVRAVAAADAWQRRLQEWHDDRAALAELEDVGTPIDADRWEGSDEEAVAMLRELDPAGPPLSAIDRLRDAVNSYGWDDEGLIGSGADHAAILYDLLNDLGMGRWPGSEGQRVHRAVLDEPGTKVRVTVLMEGELLGGADQGANLALILGQACGALMLAIDGGHLADADGTPLRDGCGNTRAMIEVIR